MQDVASKNAYFFRTRSEDKSNLLNRPNTFSFINLLTDKIYFKTDKNFRKTKQLFENPQVALCWSGIQVEGLAENKGLVADEPGKRFEKGYKEFLWNSYNAYSHVDTEILIQVTPKHVEVWDTSDGQYAYQLFIDFDSRTVEVKPYDVKK